jgi:hypothetical protein
MKNVELLKENTFQFKILNSQLNSFFILFMCISLINISKSNNSTTCYEMYLNSTIKENCFNSTACCYLEYTFIEKNFTKCIEKINDTENICEGVIDVANKEYVDMRICSCRDCLIKLNFIFIILLINFIIL